MEFTNDIMHQVWDNELEILDVIHNICENNHITYSLFYGTLLGAVRHKGFIPWDDDIDLVMPRKDYEKFISVWDKETPDGYIMLKPGKDRDYPNNFIKIVKDHTTFLQFEKERDKKYHKGIFVDIFPMDKVPDKKVARKIQYAFSAINLLYSRGYTSGTKGTIGLIEKTLLLLPQCMYPAFQKWSLQVVKHWNNKPDLQYFGIETIRACKRYFPENLFSEMKKIDFEGRRYYSICDTDTILTILYGDYMQFPPIEERVWYHHPIMIDFGHNFEELEYK